MCLNIEEIIIERVMAEWLERVIIWKNWFTVRLGSIDREVIYNNINARDTILFY